MSRAQVLVTAGILALCSFASAQLKAWSHTFPGPYPNEAAVDVEVGPDGSYYVCQSAVNTNGGVHGDWAIYKYTPAGGLLWTATVASEGQFGQNDLIYDMVVDTDGNVYAVGTIPFLENSASTDRMTVVKVSNSGSEQWRSRASQTSSTGAMVDLDANGNVYAVGSTSGKEQMLVMKMAAATGVQSWTTVYNRGNGEEIGTRLVVTPSGTSYITGKYMFGDDNNVLAMAIDTNQAMLFANVLGVSSGIGQGASCAVDPANNAFYVAGTVMGGGTHNLGFWKCNATTGATVWARTYNGVYSGNDEGVDVVRDGTSNTLFLTGTVDRGVGNSDIRFARYDANGNQLWERFYAGQSGRNDRAVRSIRDGTSNTILVGEQMTQNGLDLCILKYSDAGTLVSSRNYDEGGLRQGATCVDIDMSGNLLIGGFTDREPSPQDDFWFGKFIQASVSIGNVLSGNDTTGQITLGSAAPAGGFTFDLNSSSPSVSVPAAVSIPAGSTSAPFAVDVPPFALNHTFTVSALSLEGAVLESSLLAKGPSPSSLSVSPSTVVGGATSNALMLMDGVLPEEGVLVSVVDNSSAVFTPPFINAGADDGVELFYVGTNPVGAAATRQIRASANGVTRLANITLLPAALVSLTLNPSTVVGGQSTTGTVTLTGSSSGQVVTLSDNTSVINTPASVFIGGGSSTGAFTATTSAVSASATRQISATLNGVSKIANLSLMPRPVLQTLTLSPATVKGGLNTSASLTLSQPAPPAGTVVLLGSNSSVVSVPGSLTVQDGSMSASFAVTTFPVSANATRQVSATLDGVTKTANITLTP